MRRPAQFRRRQYGDAVKLRAAEAYLAGDDKQQIVERFEITSLDALEWIVRSLLMDAARHERSKAIARRFKSEVKHGASVLAGPSTCAGARARNRELGLAARNAGTWREA